MRETAMILKLLLALFFLISPKAHAVDRQDFEAGHSAGQQRRAAACTSIAEDQRAPLDARAYALTQRGRAHEEVRDFESAMADYAEAIRIAPRYAYSYYNRAYLF